VTPQHGCQLIPTSASNPPSMYLHLCSAYHVGRSSQTRGI
jgi:hypothetical protein